MRTRELLSAMVTVSVLMVGQPPQASSKTAFDVVSIKASPSSADFIMIGGPELAHGRFLARNVPVRNLVQFAYNVQDFLISGGPGWITFDRFDIEAKAAGPLNVDKGVR